MHCFSGACTINLAYQAAEANHPALGKRRLAADKSILRRQETSQFGQGCEEFYRRGITQRETGRLPNNQTGATGECCCRFRRAGAFSVSVDVWSRSRIRLRSVILRGDPGDKRLSREQKEKWRAALGEKGVLLFNRRGFAQFVIDPVQSSLALRPAQPHQPTYPLPCIPFHGHIGSEREPQQPGFAIAD